MYSCSSLNHNIFENVIVTVPKFWYLLLICDYSVCNVLDGFSVFLIARKLIILFVYVNDDDDDVNVGFT